MTVPSNHVYVAGGSDICDALLAEIAKVEALVGSQATEQMENLHQQMQSQAKMSERWRDMADDISYWPNQHGTMSFGVRPESSRAEEAMRAEYGDAENAPSALIRMGVLRGARRAGWSMTENFRRAGF